MSLQNTVSKMNLEHLKTFHYVAKSGSFTQAAQILFLTQPAVSLQIQGLENSLRVTLFDRSRRKITLTSEGNILYTYTQKLFGLFDEIQHVFQDLNHLQTGNLTISASAVMGTYYLTKLVTQFNKRFPLIAFKIKMGNSQQVADWVCNLDSDLGLAGRVPNQRHLRQVFLHREPYSVVVSANSPLARLQRPIQVHEFVSAFLVTREKGTRTRTKIESWFKEHLHGQRLPVPLITISSLEAAKRLVASGFGATALPHLAVADEIASGTLVPIQVEQFELNADYYLTYHTDKKLSIAALHVLALLKEMAGSDFHDSELDAMLAQAQL